MARRALGKGLGALIPSAPVRQASSKEDADAPDGSAPAAADNGNGLVRLATELVHASAWQPRQVFDEEKLQELAESMREQGLIEPIVVRQTGTDSFEVIAGERRLRASKLLGWETIPAVIMEASDNRIREMALVENLQRDDLNPIEIAIAYQALQDELHLTHENIAKRLGIASRSQITNTLRLLQLPEEVKSLISEGRLAAGAARAILSLPDALSQIKLAKRAVEEGLSVREIEKLTSRKSGGKSPAASAKPATEASADVQVRGLENRLTEHLSTKVRIQDKDGKGMIQIEYYSYDDVDRILERLGLPKE